MQTAEIVESKNGMLQDLIDSIIKLNSIDEYIDTLNDKLSEQDSKLSDLRHVLENNKLNATQCCAFIKEMQKVCNERRLIKNDIIISSVYKNNINKLTNADNRKMIINELYKKKKQLESEYKFRIYTKEELVELGVAK